MTGLDPIITAARIGWDKGDPWGSGMMLLGAVCDFYTVLGFAPHVDGWPTVPEEIGYRPAMGLSVQSLLVDADTDGFEHDWQFEDFTVECVAEALGFGVQIAADGEPDVAASVEDWNVAPVIMQRTMRVLHRYLNLVQAAGLDY